MSRPLFSCVVPVKGPRPYFDEAVASLVNQGLGDDLEIIVQDGTTKHAEYTETVDVGDVKVKWFREADCGQSDALNKGFTKANGEWFFWLNADDVLLPRALVRVKDFVERIEHVEWIAGNQVLVDDKGSVLKCSVGNGWHDWLYRHSVPHVYGPSSFFKRELFGRVGGFDSSLTYCMDWDLWIKFMKTGSRFERIGEYLWAQRQWNGSKTQRKLLAQEHAAFWGEIGSMLRRNGFEITWLGTVMMRTWRFLNGNIPRQMIDTIRYSGHALKSIYA